MVAVQEDLALTGDFEQTYRAHYPTLARRARKLFPADEADDAVQETFLRAWIHHGAKDPGVPWLLTVLRNLAIDRWRRRTADPVGDLATLDSPVEGPDEKVIALEERRTVRNAIRGLTDGQRQAIHLREWQGFSHNRIAERLGTTIPSVESLLLRGRRRLRRTLEGVLGVAMWPAAGTWRRFRHLLEGASSHAPATAPVLSTTLAQLATAAVVVTAGIAGGGLGAGGDAPDPAVQQQMGSTKPHAGLVATDGTESGTPGVAGGSLTAGSGAGSTTGGSSAPAANETTSESPADAPPTDSDKGERLPPPDTSNSKTDGPDGPETPGGPPGGSDPETPGPSMSRTGIKGATSSTNLSL